MSFSKLPLLALTSTIFAAPAFSQTAFDNTDVAETRNEALQEQIEEDFERDIDRFGNLGRDIGFDGSLALRGTVTDGNSDGADLGIGANFGYYDGMNGYSLQLNYSYSEDDGTTTDESLFYDFEYTRDITERAYGFAKLQGTVDEFSAYETDTFVGIGLGYLVYDRPDLQWAVQAGPGYRVAELNVLDADFDEAALSLSSELLYMFNDTTYLTNDTDIIASDSDTAIYNELGVTVAMSDQLALRTSVAAEHHTDPQPGFDDTDYVFGVSLVYNFN